MEGSRAILEVTIPHVYLTPGWKREEKGGVKVRENETKIGMGEKGIRIVEMRRYNARDGWMLRRVRVKVHSTVN